jgi:hypothetical protein
MTRTSAADVLREIASLDISSPAAREQARKEAEERERHYSGMRQKCLAEGMSEKDADIYVTGARMLDFASTPGIREHIAELNADFSDDGYAGCC